MPLKQTPLKQIQNNIKPKRPTNKSITKQVTIKTNKQSDKSSDDDDLMILW